MGSNREEALRRSMEASQRGGRLCDRDSSGANLNLLDRGHLHLCEKYDVPWNFVTAEHPRRGLRGHPPNGGSLGTPPPSLSRT